MRAGPERYLHPLRVTRPDRKWYGATYLFYLNYNAVDRRYEMLTLHSNWSQSARFELRISPDGSWRLFRAAAPSADGRVNRSNWGVVRFPDADTMIWETRLNRADEPPDRWTLSFVDTARRVP